VGRDNVSFFYQDTGFALHLLRHTGLIFLYLGFLYGLQVLRQTRLPRLPAAVLGNVALMALWQCCGCSCGEVCSF